MRYADHGQRGKFLAEARVNHPIEEGFPVLLNRPETEMGQGEHFRGSEIGMAAGRILAGNRGMVGPN